MYKHSLQHLLMTINVFLISNFRLVLNLVCFLLGISPASDNNQTPEKYPKEYRQNQCLLSTLTNHHILETGVMFMKFVLISTVIRKGI